MEGYILHGVPQESRLGPLLLNIHICDPFYFLEDLDIASNADDSTVYTVNEKQSQSLVHYKHLHHCTLDGLTTTS